jgi:hypothetical protein
MEVAWNLFIVSLQYIQATKSEDYLWQLVSRENVGSEAGT